MDTQSLITFVTLAEYRNFTKTADSLFVAQSTVTNRIADLEREVGKQLFERNKRKVTLTEEGHIFLSYARRIIELANAGIQDVNSLNKYQETLRIGTTNTIYECHLFPKITEYMKQNPQSAVKVTIGHSKNLVQGIQDHLYDVVYAYLPFQKAGYQCERFAVDQLLLVANNRDTTYDNGIKKKDLPESNYLYCDFALQEVGLFIRELFPAYYQFGFEIDNSTKLIPYLLELGGISFIPERIAEPYMESGQLKSIQLIDFETPKINCYRIYHKENTFVQNILKGGNIL